jgi:predicted CXXCH cytochrome family protein
MSLTKRWTKSTFIFGGAAIWGLLLVSCVTTSRTIVTPPDIPGAAFVGSGKCAQCHEEVSHGFLGASHAKLAVKGDAEAGCESCHGPASLHVKAGGGAGNIINPTAETCYQCHLDKRGEFSLPYAHQVGNGKMSCSDCHDPHQGDAIAGRGLDMEAMNASCVKCHTAQEGPFVYSHGAMKDGCVTCHNPHGSVNAKMLKARDNNLCLQCHLLAPTTPNSGQINANSLRQSLENHTARMLQGSCWSAGCHEAPHGSNANYHLRY